MFRSKPQNSNVGLAPGRTWTAEGNENDSHFSMEATPPLSAAGDTGAASEELQGHHLLNLSVEEQVPHPEGGGGIPVAAHSGCLHLGIGPRPELCMAWA